MQVRGAREVERTLTEIAPREAERLLKQTLGSLGQDVVRDARRGMKFAGPFSVGKMRRGTKKRARRTRRQIVQVDVIVAGAFYWRFYEYGQGLAPRRRMFGAALDKLRPRLASRLQELFMKKLIARLERVRRQNRARTSGAF